MINLLHLKQWKNIPCKLRNPDPPKGSMNVSGATTKTLFKILNLKR